MYKVIVLLVFVGVVHFYRGKFLYAWQPRVNDEAFHGDLYQVGECYVGKRFTDTKPKQTIVCIHGFMEDMRYFTEVYEDPAIELILINSCGYHSPFSLNNLSNPEWAQAVPYPEGSIEYDAHVLGQAVENLATTKKILLHGHSRGGAVVLEAVKQRPALLGNLEVMLESPILPGGELNPALGLVFNRVGFYLLPLGFTLIKKLPFDFYSVIYKPLTARKRTLLPGLLHSTKSYTSFLENVANIDAWWDTTNFSIYDNVARGTILIGAVDRVLDRKSMVASAEASHSKINMVLTEDTTHYSSLEQPSYARDLAAKAIASSRRKKSPAT